MTAVTRKTVRVHRQAMQMAAVVRRHLQRFPQDGALFAIDFERALADLGFDLSQGMRRHLLARLHPPVPDGGGLYDAVKLGRVRLPAQIRLNLSEPPTANGGKGDAADEATALNVDENEPTRPILQSPPSDFSFSPAARTITIPPPKPGTGGYSVLVQLTDDLVNRVIGLAYDEGLIPHQWQGTYQTTWAPFKLEIDADYDVNIQKPTLDFNTIYHNGVALNLSAAARLRITFAFIDFPSGTLPTFSDAIEATVAIRARVVGTAEVKNSGVDTAAVYLNLVNLEELDVQVTAPGLPPLVRDLIRDTIRRIAQVETASYVLPLSFSFERLRRAGVPIVALASRIRPPAGGRPGTLTIAIDTVGSGDATTIPHIIPTNQQFGFITTKHLLVNQAWPIIRNQEFPRTEDGVEIHDPELDLRNHYIYFFVKATKEIDCLPDIDADATVHLVFESFLVDGVHRTRLKSIHEVIDLDIWDQLFYTLLLGLLLGGLGGAGLGVIGMIAFNVIIAVLEGKGETAIGNAVQQASVGFRNKIPGTNIIAEASTPIAPWIYDELIFGYGDAAFYREP